MSRSVDELNREILGTGWSFPVRITDAEGHVAAVSYEEDIRQSIRIILSTAKGERVMRPDFGCGIHDLVFGAISTQFITRVQLSVTEALRTYEARIDVLKVEVETARIDEGRMDVIIDYEVQSTNQPGNFVFPFYIREAF